MGVQLWTQQPPSTSARTPSPNTTLACCLRLSSTTLSMEDFTFARQRELAKPESTLVRNVFKAFQWVEAYLEDPIMVAEFRIYLEQNFCLSGGEWEDCKQLVEEHFTAMHNMAMEKFFIPQEICNQEPVCGGSPTFPPKPTDSP